MNKAHPKTDERTIHRFDIWLTRMPSSPHSHVQSGYRPVIVVSNNQANAHSPVVTVIPLTSRLKKMAMPTHVLLRGQGLICPSVALYEQIVTIDRFRLRRRVGSVRNILTRLAINHALRVQLGMAA